MGPEYGGQYSPGGGGAGGDHTSGYQMEREHSNNNSHSNVLTPTSSRQNGAYGPPQAPAMVTRTPGSPARSFGDPRDTDADSRRSGERNRSRARGSRTASGQVRTCKKCGEILTGQFVRALDGTFHLDCFRCRVSHNPGVSVWFLPVASSYLDMPACNSCLPSVQVRMHTKHCIVANLETLRFPPLLGLRADRRIQILPRRRRDRRTIPTLRDRLFPAARPALPPMRRCPAWIVHHGTG
jgi:hypothetical protein